MDQRSFKSEPLGAGKIGDTPGQLAKPVQGKEVSTLLPWETHLRSDLSSHIRQNMTS